MVEENNPLVTVIVPSYNHEKYICETINSIINQTYKNIEIIRLKSYKPEIYKSSLLK